MNEQIVITAGKKYIDIDAYASIFAYRILLQNLGYNAYAFTTAKENESVSEIIRNMNFKFDEVDLNEPTKFIILDVSNPDFFDVCINHENIIEVIDHHTGYESYWKEKQIKNQIEFIGSICTIIFEKYEENRKEHLLTPELCKMLIAGILDNTLNLKSNITTKRDIVAYKKLLSIGNIESNWGKLYFGSCYKDLEETLEEHIKNDLKIEKTSSLLPEVIGQLIVLDKDIIFNNLDRILDCFKEYDKWVLNVISLEEGKNYLIYNNSSVKDSLETLFDLKADINYLMLDQCMLRKELIKKAREYDLNK